MKNAFINAAGVLTSWGYAEANGDDTLVEVPDDFDLEPGQWKYSGGEWVAYTVPPPQLSPAEILATNTSTRDSLLSAATLAIAPLQDAVDLEEATDDETAKLKKWKQYRVAVNRIDLTLATPSWPVAPV